MPWRFAQLSANEAFLASLFYKQKHKEQRGSRANNIFHRVKKHVQKSMVYLMSPYDTFFL